MWKYMRQHLLLFFGAVLVCPLSLAIQMKAQLLKGEVLNSALHGDLFSTQGPLPALLLYFFFSVLLAFVYATLRTHFAQRCTQTIRQAFFKSYLSRSFRQFRSLSEGEVIAQYSQQISSIEFEFFVTLGLLAEMIVTVIFAVGTLIYIHALLGIIYAFLLAIPLLIPPLFEKIIQQAAEERLKTNKSFTGNLSSYLKVFELIKNMQIEERIARDFDQGNDELRRAELALEKKKAAGFSISFLTSLLGQFGAVALTAYLIFRGKLEAGSFISVTGITMVCGAPLYWISNLWQTLISSRAARRDVLTFLADAEDRILVESSYPAIQPELLKESAVCARARRRQRSKPVPAVTTTITAPPKVEYRNVSFGFQSEQMLIENFSATLEAGSHTLITGPSGCGKSTLANLLLRYDDVLKGEILIDGYKLQEIGDFSSFSSVSRQEAILFSDSFRENLTLGNPNICDEEVFALLKKVGLEKWADKSSLDKSVEGQGENLSGGEKKRLSLVRTLLRKTPLIILDEPLANIDPDNIERVETLITCLDNCTLLVISHQGSEAFRASFDQIIEFEGGGKIEISAAP